MEVYRMKKLKIKFWHFVFCFGTLLEDLGCWVGCKGLDKLDEIDRNDSDAL